MENVCQFLLHKRQQNDRFKAREGFIMEGKVLSCSGGFKA